MRISKLLSNKTVTYPGSRFFIEIQVNSLCLAFIHHFPGDRGVGVAIAIVVFIGVGVRIGLGLGPSLDQWRCCVPPTNASLSLPGNDSTRVEFISLQYVVFAAQLDISVAISKLARGDVELDDIEVANGCQGEDGVEGF